MTRLKPPYKRMLVPAGTRAFHRGLPIKEPFTYFDELPDGCYLLNTGNWYKIFHRGSGASNAPHVKEEHVPEEIRAWALIL